MHRIVAIILLATASPVLAEEKVVTSHAPQTAAAAAPEATAPGGTAVPPEQVGTQTAVIAGKKISYEVRVGAVPIRDKSGETVAQVMYTAYVVPGRGQRPVSFAFNGGPGAASSFLNFGTLGPKRVQYGTQGDSASARPLVSDNPNSWLDFTDLVFIDPVGTGYSRSFLDAEQTRKGFFTAEADIAYLSRVIFDWLVANRRVTSPKYVIGESYGGYRTPRIAHYLQNQIGVGLNGIVMVSPLLSPPLLVGGDPDSLSPMGYAVHLPSMHAAWLERQGKPADPGSLAAVEDYARGEFVTDLLKGRADQQATERLARKVTELTGLDPDLVRRLDGRIDFLTYIREFRRADGQIASLYDPNVTGYDPFPASAALRGGDPILSSSRAPLTQAYVDLVTNQIGYPVDGPYLLLSSEVIKVWERDKSDIVSAELRQVMAADPDMGVLIAHGTSDLACPYFVSKLIIDQMPGFGRRAQLKLFPGGHMFYNRPQSAADFRSAAMAMYR